MSHKTLSLNATISIQLVTINEIESFAMRYSDDNVFYYLRNKLL